MIAAAVAADGRTAADGRVVFLPLDVRGNCGGIPRNSGNSVVIAALPWQWPRITVEITTVVSAEPARSSAVRWTKQEQDQISYLRAACSVLGIYLHHYVHVNSTILYYRTSSLGVGVLPSLGFLSLWENDYYQVFI